MVNWIAVGVFTALSAFAGIRLLLLWRQTRKLPELLIAILILGVGTVAVGGGFVLRSLHPEGPFRSAALFVPSFGADVGMAALLFFTWRVYRPESAVARAVACLAAGAFAALFGYAVLQGSPRALEAAGLSLANSLLYVGTMGWSAVEALVYWSAMRRRLRLGLADALTTNRVLLWGVATGVAGVGIAIGTVARFGAGVVEFETSWVALCYAGHGLVSAVAFWLAFAPPERYVRWIRDRAAAAAPTPGASGHA